MILIILPKTQNSTAIMPHERAKQRPNCWRYVFFHSLKFHFFPPVFFIILILKISSLIVVLLLFQVFSFILLLHDMCWWNFPLILRWWFISGVVCISCSENYLIYVHIQGIVPRIPIKEKRWFQEQRFLNWVYVAYGIKEWSKFFTVNYLRWDDKPPSTQIAHDVTTLLH